MTSYAKDPTTGHPLFRDSDAPDVKQDPQEAAEFAAKVGTRLIGTTTERTNYEYARPGLLWWDTTLGTEFVYLPAGWTPRYTPRTAFTPAWTGVTMGSSATTGWWCRNGELIEGEAVLTLAAGWNFSSAVRMDAPVPILSPADSPVGQVSFVDTGTAYYLGALVRTGTRLAPMAPTTGGQLVDVANTDPFPWTSGDEIRLQFRYLG